MSLDYDLARDAMVNQQVRPWNVLDPRVLDTLAAIRREDYVPARYRRLAFADMALPLEFDQVMMKPVVEGRLLQALGLQPGHEVLEIGTGSGYLTACLAHLARDVVSIDIQPAFIERAGHRLREQGVLNVQLETAQAQGYRPGRRFDAVAVTGAVAAVPQEWFAWLKPGGCMFVVHGQSPLQHAMLLRSDAQGRITEEGLFETELPYLSGAEPVPHFAL